MRARVRRRPIKDAELNITAFLNLMIILVPVLLVGMVFSQITVLDLQLPELGESDPSALEDLENQTLEVIIRPEQLVVNFPAGVTVRRIPATDGGHDFEELSLTLQAVQRRLLNEGVDKEDILILSEPDTDYQTIVSAMDTARSYPAVVAASVVPAKLFPAISLGDAPARVEDQP
ncbi:ExbD/TolR family protein [Marinimicrobium alkaliphilum]|uniref:ExbD/TolR family protein n=1 Tax=Marinimicrobium alkaliphilum TaxID=2202654 RepID=UPI000DB9EC5C|nr:biopolymer transporter ExbD [Marinimicrobium alkaliphilum]